MFNAPGVAAVDATFCVPTGIAQNDKHVRVMLQMLLLRKLHSTFCVPSDIAQTDMHVRVMPQVLQLWTLRSASLLVTDKHIAVG
jgi:hypothetical protein